MQDYGKTSVDVGIDDPIFFVPRYQAEPAIISKSENVDWGISLTGIPQFWAQTKGEGIKVAVLDTGIDLTHPDLEAGIDSAKDFTGSRFGPQDKNSHGTHVAGTIAARQNNTGLVGAAPECRLLIAKVLGDSGSGTSRMVSSGVYWAVENGADIISMSLGSPVSSQEIYESIKFATSKGIFVVAAAGNEGPNLGTVGYPGRYEETIAVGAIDQNRKIANFSSRGPQVDVVAPGYRILSTIPGGHGYMSGSSMACPLVSGVVTLMLAKHAKFGSETPINTTQDLRNHLRRVAIDLGPEGYDPSYGAGLINPEALLKTPTPTPEPAPTPGSPGVGPGLSLLALNASDLTASGLDKVREFKDGVNNSGEIEIRIDA